MYVVFVSLLNGLIRFLLCLFCLAQGVAQGLLPQVLWGVAPHDHTKCQGSELDFAVPACLRG